MSRPSRETTAGRAYLDLRARARREGRPTDELIVLYVLERFLFRLARSNHRSRLARLDRARHPLRIDVSVGDPVTPRPVEVEFPWLLDEPFTIVGYPLETVLAEKIVTMIERGDTTTRERDFADVFLLIRRHAVNAETFARALRATAAHRQAELQPLRDTLVVLATARQADWARFVERSGLEHNRPASYAEAIKAVATFADPVLTGEIATGSWHPEVASWAAP